MDREILLYRLYRLRRLVAAGAILPALSAMIFFDGATGVALAAASALATTAHALRFPNGWTETAAASLSLSAAWILLAALASGTGPFGFLLGLPVVLIAVAILFFQLVARIPDWITLGTPAPISTRTTRRTALPPEKAERAITLWPGREDARTSTGEPDETGAFDVKIAHRMPVIGGGGEEDSAFDVAFRARVEDDGDEGHLLAVLDEAGQTISLTRHSFAPVRRGTRVVVEEEGAVMPAGMRLGFWLQDFAADHLTDEIDRAEGRAERANRFATQETLMTVIAEWMLARAIARSGDGALD